MDTVFGCDGIVLDQQRHGLEGDPEEFWRCVRVVGGQQKGPEQVLGLKECCGWVGATGLAGFADGRHIGVLECA